MSGMVSSDPVKKTLVLVATLLLSLAACHAKDDPPILTAPQETELAQYVSAALPDGLSKLDVDFEGKVHLVGWDVSPKQATYAPGTQLTVTLVWRCDQRLEPGWLLFTHLLSRDGAKLDNLDEKGPLRKMEGVTGQPMPPSRWEPGKFYSDKLTFTVPPEPSPQIVVAPGIYKGDKRLAIRSGGGDKEGRAFAARLSTGARDARTALKELEARQLPEGAAITIDGKLDEAAWAKAASTGPFVDVGSGRENPGIPVQGSARLLWDAKYLYVGFEVADTKVHGGWPKDAKDPHLWEKDTVEIMTDPDGDGDNKDYYEIQINPAEPGLRHAVRRIQFAQRQAASGPFGHEEWTAALTSAVVVHGTLDDDSDVDQGYTVEAEIPWASFAKAKRSPPASGRRVANELLRDAEQRRHGVVAHSRNGKLPPRLEVRPRQVDGRTLTSHARRVPLGSEVRTERDSVLSDVHRRGAPSHLRVARLLAHVALELAVERLAIEAEHLRRERLVAADGLEHAQDVAALDLLHRHELGGIVAGDDDVRAPVARGPSRAGRRPTICSKRGERDRALDAVLQLAHVARPGVGERASRPPRARGRRPACRARVAKRVEEVLREQEHVARRARAAAAARRG